MDIAARQLLQAGRKTVQIDVPEWDGAIILKPLSAAQAIAFSAYYAALGDTPGANLRVAAWLLSAAWVDDMGQPVLATGDIDLLLETQTVELLLRLGTTVTEISNTKADAQASAEKNLPSSQS